MALFDVNKYQTPKKDEVDLKATLNGFQTFIQAYQNSREKVGQPRMPKVTQGFSLVPPSTVNVGPNGLENILIQREDDKEEFKELHGLFLKGYAGISHPFKPEVTERKRSIFFNRYILGLSVNDVADKTWMSRDVVIEESAEAVIQFSHALELVIFKSETEPLIEQNSD